MKTKQAKFGATFVRWVAASAVLWLALEGGVYWELRRILQADLQAGASTDADSIGLPLVSLGILLSIVLLIVSVTAAAISARRGAAASMEPPAS